MWRTEYAIFVEALSFMHSTAVPMGGARNIGTEVRHHPRLFLSNRDARYVIHIIHSDDDIQGLSG